MRIQTNQRIQDKRAPVIKLHVRKGDRVKILAGKDVGKVGSIIEARPSERRVVIEGLNLVKRHTRAQRLPTGGNIPGGIIEKPAALHISNVMLICPSCSKPTRSGHKIAPNGKSVRACKHCGEMIGAS